MEFKDITTWSVSKGLATPVNPYSIPEMVIGGEIEQQLAKSRARILKLKFESIKLQHTFATNAPDGSYSADRFGEIVWQFYEPIKRDGINPEGWVNCTDNNPEFAQTYNLKTRQLLPMKQEIQNPVIEPKIGETWLDGLGNEVELLDMGYDQRFPRFLCKKLKNGSECYREFNELISKVDFLPFIDQVKAESPKFGEWISVEAMYNSELQKFAHNTAVDFGREMDASESRQAIKQMIVLGAQWQSKQQTEITRCLEAFINSYYTGCSKDELNQLRINGEKALKAILPSPPKTL